MIFTGKSHPILQRDTTPCTGHPLVTKLLLGARTSGCKNATAMVSPKQRRVLDAARSFLPEGGHSHCWYIWDPSYSSCSLACCASRQGNFSSKAREDSKDTSFVIRCCVARVKRNCCRMPRFRDTIITHNAIFHSFNKCWICKGSFPSFCLRLGSQGRAVYIIIFRCHPLYWLSEWDAQIMAANARSRDRMELVPFWEKLK